MANYPEDTTVKLKRKTKEELDNLDFVRKKHTYDKIVLALINYYKKRIEREGPIKNKKEQLRVLK